MSFADAGLIGLAVALTLLAGLGLSYFEDYAFDRGLIPRRFSRPGAIALLIGAGLTALVTDHIRGNAFIGAAALVAVASGLRWARQGGQLTSFAFLWVGASGVVFVAGAQVPAFGMRAADIVFSGFLVAAFCSLLREADAAGSYGWFASLMAAGGLTAMCNALHRGHDTALGVLITGAIFGVVAATPFGSGMLSRIGSRFTGLVVAVMAIRAAAGSPRPMIDVTAVGLVCTLLWVLSLDRPYRLRVLLGGFALAGAMAAVSIPALNAVRQIYKPMKNTVAQTRALTKTDPKIGLDHAANQLQPIEHAFRVYANRLNKKNVKVAKYLPFIGVNLRATTASAEAAADLTGAARSLLNEVNVREVSPKQGIVSRDELMHLAEGLDGVHFLIHRSQAKIAAGGTDLLIPELRSGVNDLLGQLRTVDRRVQTTLDGTAAADRLLGFTKPRHFFIAVQNTSEARATGGYIANFGIVTMRNGRVSARFFGRTSIFDDAKDKPRVLHAPLDFRRRYSQFDVDRNWPNVNLSPDFPTTARVIADQFAQYSGVKVDGVIAVDPIALAALMNLTGPITVAPWPVPLTAQNTAKVLLHDEYVAFDNNFTQRVDFLGNVANRVFDALVLKGFNNVLSTGPLVHELTARRQLQFWTPDAITQRFFGQIKADGAVAPPQSDGVMVTTQNAGANKTDYFLKRSFAYDSTVHKSGGKLQVDSMLVVKLRNDAPSSGEPRYVIGPNTPKVAAGLNRTFFTVYSRFALTSATIDGAKLVLNGQPELGRFAYSAFVDVPARSTRTIEVHFSGHTNDTHRYVLDLWHQPLIADEPFTLAVHGAGPKGALQYTGTLNRDVRVSLAVG